MGEHKLSYIITYLRKNTHYETFMPVLIPTFKYIATPHVVDRWIIR